MCILKFIPKSQYCRQNNPPIIKKVVVYPIYKCVFLFNLFLNPKFIDNVKPHNLI